MYTLLRSILLASPLIIIGHGIQNANGGKESHPLSYCVDDIYYCAELSYYGKDF